jgi:hypothetical protein
MKRTTKLNLMLAILLGLLATVARAENLNVSAGGLIYLQPGHVYDSITGLTGQFSALPNNTSLVGRQSPDQPMAIIRFASNQGYFAKSVSANRVFKGIRFESGGLFLEGAGANGFTVDDCEFAVSVTAGEKRCGLEVTSKAINAKITNCLFAGTNGQLNVYSHADCDGLTIANNEFINTKGGIHWGTDGVLKNLLFEQNYFDGITAQAVELQAKGNSPGVVIQDNWVQNHKLRPTYAENTDAYSYSVPFQGGSGVQIKRNVSIQKKSNAEPDGVGVRIIFEVGGQGLLCEDNYSDGGNHVVAGNGANGNGNVRNNKFLNYNQAPSNANGNTTTYTNNGPNVVNSIDLIARGRPHRNQRYGTTPIPPQPPTILKITSGTIDLATGVGTFQVQK